MSEPNNIRYTTDGKKVVVIGRLNSTDTIVQEIFVGEDGSEIPAGEQFITKSLLDEPRVPWAEKKALEAEENLKRVGDEVTATLLRLREQQGIAKAKIAALRKLTSEAAAEQLAFLEAFVAGEITHVVIMPEFGCRPVISKFDSEIADDWRSADYGLKLLTLFGGSDGSLSWHIHHYYDGSGGSVKVYPAKSYEDALAFANESYLAEVKRWHDGEREYPPAEEWNGKPEELSVPYDVQEYWRARRLEELEKSIVECKKELARMEEEYRGDSLPPQEETDGQ